MLFSRVMRFLAHVLATNGYKHSTIVNTLCYHNIPVCDVTYIGHRYLWALAGARRRKRRLSALRPRKIRYRPSPCSCFYFFDPTPTSAAFFAPTARILVGLCESSASSSTSMRSINVSRCSSRHTRRNTRVL